MTPKKRIFLEAITAIIPTHNPHPGRLQATLQGLRAQTLPADSWKLVIVDNASSKFPENDWLIEHAPRNTVVVKEPVLGLTSARRCGLTAALSDYVVLVDDDNVLDPDYLKESVRIFSTDATLGAIGGRSLGVFETPPPAWQTEVLGMLALRDLGDKEIVARSFYNPEVRRNEYPPCAPIGAGMAMRAEAAQTWLDSLEKSSWRRQLDRTGASLTSGGDNDIVMTLMERGWAVGYYPSLRLNHLIPTSRIQASYLERLNRAMQRSWMQVLTAHNANPWPPIPAWTVPLRSMKAWFTHRAWSSPLARVRWSGARGHFEGRATRLEGRSRRR